MYKPPAGKRRHVVSEGALSLSGRAGKLPTMPRRRGGRAAGGAAAAVGSPIANGAAGVGAAPHAEGGGGGGSRIPRKAASNVSAVRFSQAQAREAFGAGGWGNDGGGDAGGAAAPVWYFDPDYESYYQYVVNESGGWYCYEDGSTYHDDVSATRTGPTGPEGGDGYPPVDDVFGE